MKKIAIIGGGAAGMMVAATILESLLVKGGGPQSGGGFIHLFEKNSRLGAKVIISGGGRCNVTTGLFKTSELLTKYPRGAEFLVPALKNFGPKAIRRRFESHGVSLKQEADGRIFPVSDDGKEIVSVFEKLFHQGGVHVHLKEGVTQLIGLPGQVPYQAGREVAKPEGFYKPTSTLPSQGGSFLLTTDTGTYEVDIVVLTTGGNAYAHTGSTGDGYAWARALGHTITPLGPSLNSFLTREERLHACSGTSFENARIKSPPTPFSQGGSNTGPVLLTHFGISGPAVFAFSSHIPYAPVTREQPYPVLLQPDASRGVAQRQQLMVDRATQTPKKELGSLFREFFTKKLIDIVLEHLGYDPHLPIGNLKKDDRLILAKLLGDGIPLTLIQRRPGDEFVTAGGVSLDEVDPTSGQSRVVSGLYFAGEILDVDGYTGGYNLTSSRAMGKLVGEHIAHSERM